MSARRWLEAGDPALAPVPDLVRARATIAAYRASDPSQAATRAFVLEWIDAHPEALERRALAGHLTASGLLLDHAGQRALLTLHAKLGRWLQLGGHCDGDGNLPGVALRECLEESGITTLAIDPLPFDLDCHRIPARPGEPEHWHLDTRFVLRAGHGACERLSPESHALRWVSPQELSGLECDDSVRRLFARAFAAGRPSPGRASP